MDRLCILNVPLINRYIDILDLAPLFVLIDHHHNVKSTLTTHDCGGLSMNVSEYVMCIVKRLWKNHLFSNHASHTIIGYWTDRMILSRLFFDFSMQDIEMATKMDEFEAQLLHHPL